MTVYSYVSSTVLFFIGDQAYRIDGPDKIEIKVPAGEYPFTAYIVYSDDESPVIQQHYYHRYEKNVTRYFLATTGTLWVDGQAELTIRSTCSAFSGVTRMEQVMLSFETQNCELKDRRNGFLSPTIPKSIIRGFKVRMVFTYIFAVLIMVIGIVFTVLLSTVLDEAGPMSESEFIDILPILISPVLAVVVLAQSTRDRNFIKICRKIPILTEEKHYDDL